MNFVWPAASLVGRCKYFCPAQVSGVSRERPIKDATWVRIRFLRLRCALYPCAITVSVLFQKACPPECPSSVYPGCENRKYSSQSCRPSLSLLTEGCPGLCNSNGRCTLDQNGWHCVCQPGWRGAGCDVAMETLCTDSKDNEGGKRC